MKATCTVDLNHDKFITTAHVVEEWVVTFEGDFVESLGVIETSSGPDSGNLWTCRICGAEATV